MSEGYSQEKFKNAKTEGINPDSMRDLEKFRELKIKWKAADAKQYEGPVMVAIARDIASLFSREQWQLFSYYLNRKKHEALEQTHGQTKEGQLELAHEEAEILNDTLDARAERLSETFAHKNESPKTEKEYRVALSDFNDFVEDLRESDLEAYARDIHYKKIGQMNYKKGVDANIWHSTSEAQSARLLQQLETLPDGTYARELYERLQDRSLTEKEFFDPIYAHRERMKTQPFDKNEPMHVVTKDLGSGRVLQVRFWDNGYIQFEGRDPEHDKKFSSNGEYFGGATGDIFGPSISDLF